MSDTVSRDAFKALDSLQKKDKSTTSHARKKLVDREVKIISFIEQTFWETGFIPSNEVVAEHTGYALSTVESCYRKRLFRQALAARGIDLEPGKSTKALTPQQIMLANVLLNIADKRSTREKLASLEVSSQQLNVWLRQPAFSDYLRKRAEEHFKASDYKAYLSLINAVEAGDQNATKFFFEMRGIYRPSVDVHVNVEAVVMRVVEVVAKHVRDPAILASIATELKELEAVS